MKNMTRRDFLESAASFSALTLVSSPLDWIKGAYAFEQTESRLSWLAHRGTHFEGDWNPASIEGEIPADLRGTLYRIGPGSKNTQGTALQHFFDGDALVTSLQFNQGQVALKSRFVNTEERKKEAQASKMLYDDYGTASPGRPQGYKYSPNIHVLPWAGRLLALSESSHPTALNPVTLETLGGYDFDGSLPWDVTFTAHPKIEPETGVGYGYGISKFLNPALKVYRMNPLSGKLLELYSIPLGGFYPIHDMMMTQNYLVFVVSPVQIKLLDAALTAGPISKILKYDRSKPLRIFVVPKNGVGEPLEFESSPSGLIFHHCNAYEDQATGAIVFHSMLMADDSAFRIFQAWSQTSLPAAPDSRLTRFELDLSAKKVTQRTSLSDGTPIDFPCIDPSRIGTRLEGFHAIESRASAADPLSFDTLMSWSFERGATQRYQCDRGQTLGEPVYVTGPTTNWILQLGYDSGKDQTFLDIRKPVTLELIARTWFGRFIPLGFHGLFNNT